MSLKRRVGGPEVDHSSGPTVGSSQDQRDIVGGVTRDFECEKERDEGRVGVPRRRRGSEKNGRDYDFSRNLRT